MFVPSVADVWRLLPQHYSYPPTHKADTVLNNKSNLCNAVRDWSLARRYTRVTENKEEKREYKLLKRRKSFLLLPWVSMCAICEPNNSWIAVQHTYFQFSTTRPTLSLILNNVTALLTCKYAIHRHIIHWEKHTNDYYSKILLKMKEIRNVWYPEDHNQMVYACEYTYVPQKWQEGVLYPPHLPPHVF